MTRKDYEKIASVLYQYRALIGNRMDFLDQLCLCMETRTK